MKTTDYYWGSCPDCPVLEVSDHATPWRYANIGRNHWFYCDEHRVKWCVGSNLFSSWHLENEDDWRRNEEMLAGYRKLNEAAAPLTLTELHSIAVDVLDAGDEAAAVDEAERILEVEG